MSSKLCHRKKKVSWVWGLFQIFGCLPQCCHKNRWWENNNHLFKLKNKLESSCFVVCMCRQLPLKRAGVWRTGPSKQSEGMCGLWGCSSTWVWPSLPLCSPARARAGCRPSPAHWCILWEARMLWAPVGASPPEGCLQPHKMTYKNTEGAWLEALEKQKVLIKINITNSTKQKWNKLRKDPYLC